MQDCVLRAIDTEKRSEKGERERKVKKRMTERLNFISSMMFHGVKSKISVAWETRY